MSSWLRNIQGQLTDLANEVLNEATDVLAEATEEVPDPDGEIIVAKKKCAEAEKQLAIESAKVESLSNEKTSLEQQLYDAHVEMDTIGSKLNTMVKQRDEEIKKLKHQIEEIHESGWHEGGFPSATESERIKELQNKVAELKAIIEEAEKKEETITLSELEKRMEALRQQKEHEIQAIVESHADSMVEMREMYEEKLSSMQILPYNASSSTSNADTDAVLLEKEEVKSTSDGESDRPVVVDLGSHDELVDERIRQMEVEMEKLREEKQAAEKRSEQVELLKTQKTELANAYTELNNEFEEFKAQNALTVNANNDLTKRIDALKANLIEYEERYELCKKENAETVAQLERLSGDFARLRTGVANVSQRRDDCDTMVNEEVEKLKNALDESRTERERLRDDVQHFQVAVGEIDVELEKLREANRQLLAENQALTENLARYDSTMKDIISNSEEDIGNFREQFKEIQENHRQQKTAMSAENDALREETEAIKRQRDILMEESALLKEVNEKLRQKSATEEQRNELLVDKSRLLEQVLEEERAERKREQEEAKEKERKEAEDLMNPHAENKSEKAILQMKLKEALQANREKTEEFEKLHQENRNLEREVDLRQNCVDEMIAQTNTLQMQQETLSAAHRTLQTQNLAHERTIVQLEEKLGEEKTKNEEWEKKVKSLEEVITGGSSGEGEDEEEKKEEDVAPLKRYIAELKNKLAAVEEELKVIKEQKSEESKEAAEVRQMLERDLFEAEEVDRGLLEGIEARVKEMEEQLASKVEALETAKEENRKLEVANKEMQKRIEEKVEKVEVLMEESRNLKEAVEKTTVLTTSTFDQMSEVQNALDQLRRDYDKIQEEKKKLEEEQKKENELRQTIQQENELLKANQASEELLQKENELLETQKASDDLRQAIQTLQQENELLKANQTSEELLKAKESSEDLRQAIQALQQENEHLKGVAKTQYEENVKYYEQFQAMATHNQQIQDQLKENHETSEKRATELSRLREHLMIVEENSTREAVEAEQRETELRERVRQLEAEGHQVQEGATESNQQYQVKIASLTAQVDALQKKAEQWKGKYEMEVKAREQTQEALSSLQNVVRELSVDHERDAATASHRNLELQMLIGELKEEIGQIKEELDRQSIGRQAAEEESERRQLQLDSKQKIIEDLEVQIEELRSPKKPTESYRIDDSTLRQLFLSYFLSEPSKRPDIALLLANILEYPGEEMDKFKSAVRQSFNQGSGSSLFWGGSRSSPGPSSSNIADQFIRFLETESESSRTAPNLPIRSQNEPAVRMSMDSSSAQKSTSSTAAALDSLLR
uniref:GRIP domain-containing protein n=1 Tax=Caenorhabditis tropicalis TaxID=1561998 RepID=A0A1I7UZI2_9PELO